MEVPSNLGKFEAVGRRQRQHDIVFGRCRLKLEVELAAEAFAQRQPPGAVDAAAKRGVDDELHAARFVEEALQHDRLLGRQTPECRGGRGEIFDQLLSGRTSDADFFRQPAAGPISGRIGFEAGSDVGAQARDRG